jgi:hypothetical protein
MPLTDTDADGFEVRAGDKVSFSFGIPPRRVEGVLFERGGKLIMPTPDVLPREATLNQLRFHVGGFYKVDVSEAEYQSLAAQEEAQ